MVNRESFTNDVMAVTSYAAPHEVVSAYVGLKEYGDFFTEDKDKDFYYIYSKNIIKKPVGGKNVYAYLVKEFT